MSLLALRRHLLRASRHPLGWLASCVLVLAMVSAFFQATSMHTHPGARAFPDKALVAAKIQDAAVKWCKTDHENPARSADADSHAHDAGKLTPWLPPVEILRLAATPPDTAPPPFVLRALPSASTPPPHRPPIA